MTALEGVQKKIYC